MDIRMIKNPSKGTLDILKRRIGNIKDESLTDPDAIGLVQGRMIEMIVASDIAEKAVGVAVSDVRGSCPQNMILLVIWGDTSSVGAALKRINEHGKENAYEF